MPPALYTSLPILPLVLLISTSFECYDRVLLAFVMPKQVLVRKLLAVLSLMLFDDDDDDRPSKKFQQLKIESL